MARGGLRNPPGGRPKGTHSFDKLRQHARLCEQVAARQDRMTEAQISAAEGVKYLVARNKSGGKFKHLTEGDAKRILSGEDTENEIVEEWEKLPNTNAYAYLMDQVVGKAKNVVEADVTVGASEELMALLLEGRQRAARAKK